MELTHFNDEGRAHMVDVGEKPRTKRVARAMSRVYLAPETFRLVRDGGMKKGDVLAVAQVAGIMAAKKNSELIPMCHPIAITSADISFELDAESSTITITAEVGCTGETGVEMEALTAASVAGLTIYDMLKAVHRDMVVSDVRLLEKSGGKSGHFVRGSVAEVDKGTVPLSTSDGVVVATSISTKKGTRKVPQESIRLEVGLGVAGDAHAGAWHRMVSLLPEESVDEMRELLPKLAAGDFAENILTRGLSLKNLPVGTVLEVGECELAMTQIGKKCHSDCEISRITGKCAMPTDGVFAVVTRGGTVRPGDPIRIRR